MNDMEYIAFINKLANNAFIQSTTLASLPAPLQQNDKALMECIIKIPNASRAHLKAFNWCQTCIGVTFLFKISSANGKQISHAAWDGVDFGNTNGGETELCYRWVDGAKYDVGIIRR